MFHKTKGVHFETSKKYYEIGHNYIPSGNKFLLPHKTKEIDHLLDSVQLTSFLWLKTNNLTSAFSYTDWWRDPLLCMSVRD